MAFSIFNFFSKKASTTAQKSGSGSGVKLTNAARIGNVLQHLIDDRTLLTITIPDSNDTYTSAVFKVDRKAHTFSLDELSPIEGHKLFLRKKTLQVDGQSRGAVLSFTVHLKDQHSAKGIAYYEFDFPKVMTYVQRRAYFRAKIKNSQRISITTLHKASSISISGYVLDISTQGISVLFNSPRNIERGEILTLCRMRLPDGQKVVFDLYVRYAQKLPNERIRIGASFHDINTRNQRLIEKFVRKIERDTLRSG